MGIRLNKVLTELNIDLQSAVDFLKAKNDLGDIREDATTNTKISDEQYEALVKKFRRPLFKPLGKIDLNSISKPTHKEKVDSKPEFKPVEEKAVEKNVALPQQNNGDKSDSKKNPFISIGQINIEWRYAIGQYDVECLQDLQFNAFDKVICGILNNHGGSLSKVQLGDIMGLNVIDDPNNQKYRDKAESKILDDAIESLRGYGIVDCDFRNVYLTSIGKQALLNGKKQKSSKENITLHFDLLTKNDTLAPELVSRFASVSEEITIGDSIQIDDERIRKNILSRYPQLFDEDKGKSIGNTTIRSLKLYKVDIPVDIIYDFSTSSYDIALNCISSDAANFTDNVAFQDAILSEFFSNTREAIIYKPSIQIELEQGFSSNDEPNLLICSKSNFISNLTKIITSKLNVICLYLYEINEEIWKQLANFSAQHRDTMVCVEYIKGEEKFNGYYIKNIGIQQSDVLTTRSLCVCSNDTFYSEELFVFTFRGKDYQLPIVIKHEKRRYRLPMIASSFANGIMPKMIEEFGLKLNSREFNFDYNSMLDAKNQYENLSYLLSLFPNIDGEINVSLITLWQAHLRNCVYSLRKESEEILLSNVSFVLASQFKTKLEALTPIILTYSPQLEADINKIRLPGLNVKMRNAFIVDTSAFISNPLILNDFHLINDVVYIPNFVLEELDGLAHDESPRGKNAKDAIININRTFKTRSHFLKRGLVNRDDMEHYLPLGYDINKNDNQLLALAMKLKEMDGINSVTIIVDDRELELKAHFESILVRKKR